MALKSSMKKTVVDKKAPAAASKPVKKVSGPKKTEVAMEKAPHTKTAKKDMKKASGSKTTKKAVEKAPHTKTAKKGMKKASGSKTAKKAVEKAPGPKTTETASQSSKAPAGKTASTQTAKQATKAGGEEAKLALFKKRIDKRFLAAYEKDPYSIRRCVPTYEKEPNSVLYSVFRETLEDLEDDVKDADEDRVAYLQSYTTRNGAHFGLGWALDEEIGGESDCALAHAIMFRAYDLEKKDKTLESICISGTKLWIERNVVSPELAEELYRADLLDGPPKLV